MRKVPMTVAGAARLRLELQQLKSVQRPAVIQSITDARSNGDLAENAKLLRRHMDAVCEISSLIAEAIQCSSADGTYSSQAARSGPKPWSR